MGGVVIGTILYRIYVDAQLAHTYEDEAAYFRVFEPARSYVTVDKWTVTRLTPTGMWLENDGFRTWRRRNTCFAHPTIQAALDRLVIRKVQAVGHAKDRLEKAKMALDKARSLRPEDVHGN